MGGLLEASGDQITIRGYDLVEEVIGQRSFVEVFYLCICARFPSLEERQMIDAMLVAMVEHGLTPSAIAARLTYLGAPESLQGAVASGLLGAGARYLGTSEEVARLLYRWFNPACDATATARDLVVAEASQGRKIPGFGHPIHRREDPRVVALLNLQRQLGLPRAYSAFMREVESALRAHTGRHLPMNAAGAVGAIICDLGLPPEFGRGLALLARCAGLLGHVFEERDQPIGEKIWELCRRDLAPGQG